VLFNSPISVQKADRIISILDLEPTYKVIDIGCGEGEFLTRIQRASNADCLGIDIDSSCIEIADHNAQKYGSGEKLRFLSTDIQEAQLEKNSYELAVCIGSTHAFSKGEAAYPTALSQMGGLVRPYGLILIGEGFWRQKPEQEYLDFLGEPVGIYNSHEQNIQQAESVGFIPLYSSVSDQDEWDHFEWCFRMKAERRVIADAANDEARKKLEKVREWNRYYRKFGRTTMGFGFYLYAKPFG